MAEFIYQYWKENPEYVPDKFSIVGGFAPHAASAFGGRAGKIGAYYGGGEYIIDESELDNLVFDHADKATVIGSHDEPGRKSASTVEPMLRELFNSFEPRRGHDNRSNNTIRARKNKKGGNDGTRLRVPTGSQIPAMTMAEVTDEMLYACPDLAGPTGASEESAESDLAVEESAESDLAVEESVEADLVAEESADADDTDESDDEARLDDYVPVYMDNIEDASQQEVDAMERAVTAATVGSEDNETNIMRFLV